MAIFNQPGSAKKDTPSFANEPAPPARDNPPPAPSASAPAPADFRPSQSAPPRAAAQSEASESLIASNLTIEGKIEGTGDVRIAGKFKGDVNVQGNLSIERGAKLTGGVRADKVVVAGDLEGNIESAKRVELLDSSALTGDLKAGTLTVASGAKIRGHIECGWEDAPASARDKGTPSAKDAKADREAVAS
ncbi:bactofilin family protein [Luteimonas abyssi]|uniref:bactofilin family protein n=1 Tax=Luteimonas abyssi TaxID=1247514 RepID=UPI000737C1C7|nr:polymer-forming cytoskeletal protein [Luteimonas abyssi]